MRRRSRLAVVATSLLLGIGVAACDTDDGREMRDPTELQRWRQQSTSTSTTTTLPLATPPILLTAPDSALADGSAAPSADASADASAGSPEASQGGLIAPASEAATPQIAGGAGLTAPWADGGQIDVTFTCDGAGDAPPIQWAEPPSGTVEMALTVVDEDANGYVHWAVFGLPATAGSIGGGAPLDVGTEGRNSRSGTGWTGPCPPAGSTHQYRVTLHFFDQQLEETADAAPSALVAAIEALAFDEVSITGTYQRAG